MTHLRRELSEARTGHARLDAQLRAARAEVRSLRLRIDALEQQQEEENVVPLREELRLTRAAVAELRAQLRRARRSSSSGPGAVPMPPAVQVTAAVEAVAFELIGRLMLDKAFDRGELLSLLLLLMCASMSVDQQRQTSKACLFIPADIPSPQNPNPKPADGTARRLVMARRLARNDWNGFETAYKEALIDSGEVQPDSRGFADSTPGERSEHWKLYKARWYGEENEFLREVKAAKRAANVGGTGAVQP